MMSQINPTYSLETEEKHKTSVTTVMICIILVYFSFWLLNNSVSTAEKKKKLCSRKQQEYYGQWIGNNVIGSKYGMVLSCHSHWGAKAHHKSVRHDCSLQTKTDTCAYHIWDRITNYNTATFIWTILTKQQILSLTILKTVSHKFTCTLPLTVQSFSVIEIPFKIAKISPLGKPVVIQFKMSCLIRFPDLDTNCLSSVQLLLMWMFNKLHHTDVTKHHIISEHF